MAVFVLQEAVYELKSLVVKGCMSWHVSYFFIKVVLRV